MFLEPPDMPTLERRLRGRGTEEGEALQIKLRTAHEEMKAAVWFDHRVVNHEGQPDRAAHSIVRLVAATQTQCCPSDGKESSLKYKRITENRKRAALLGELAVYFEEGIRAPLAPEGVPSISTWLRTVRDPLVAGFFEASSETYRALEAAGSPKADRMAVRAARHILWEQRESAAYSIVGAEAEGEVGLALPSRITPVERAPRVEADEDLLATLGDMAGRAALCDLLRRDMESKGAQPREDVHTFAVNYIEGSRADVALHMKLREAKAEEKPRVILAAAGMRSWLESMRSKVEDNGVFKRYAEEPIEPAESQSCLL